MAESRQTKRQAQTGRRGPSARKAVKVVDQGPQSWNAGHRKRFRYASDAADAINHFGQNILLSGIRPDGVDGTNELTYLALNALEKFAFTSPVVTVRLHKGSPQALIERTAEVLKTGSGMPYINNDDVLIPAYANLGVALADARDYANSNCWETMIEGKSDQELIRGMNFLLFLELALHDGVSVGARAHGPHDRRPAHVRRLRRSDGRPGRPRPTPNCAPASTSSARASPTARWSTATTASTASTRCSRR